MEPVLGDEPGETGSGGRGGQVTEQTKPVNQSRIVFGVGNEGENT